MKITTASLALVLRYQEKETLAFVYFIRELLRFTEHLPSHACIGSHDNCSDGYQVAPTCNVETLVKFSKMQFQVNFEFETLGSE